MTAHSRVILRVPIRNILRTGDEYRRMGHTWDPKGPEQRRVCFIKLPGNPRLEKNRCVLTTRGNGKHPWACVPLMSKRTLRRTAEGARRVGPEVQHRHQTGRRRSQNVGGFDSVKGQGPSRITQLLSGNTTLNQSRHIAEAYAIC